MTFNRHFFWLGTWMLSGEGFGPQDLGESESVIRMAIDHGLTQFDTAPVYGRGNSDRLLSKSHSDSITISSKTGLGWKGNTYFHNGSPKFIIQDVEASLKRLNRDVIDIMYLHWPDKSISILESVSALQTLKDQGKVKQIGCCNLNFNDIETIMSNIPIDYLQLKHSILDNNDLIIKIKKQWPNLKLLIYSIFEQGLLLNTTMKLSTSDQRNKNPIFSTKNRLKISSNPLFSSPDTTITAIMDWLTTLATPSTNKTPTINGTIIGVRNQQQWLDFIHSQVR